MSIKYDKITRRQFLIGTGGYTLILPFLPSLLPKDVLAQSAPSVRRMIVATLPHNMLKSQVFNPPAAALTQLAPNVVRALLNDSRVALSPYMSHATYTTLKNAGLITVVRGLDMMHGDNAHGNTWLTGGTNDHSSSIPFTPSFDTFINYTSSYPTFPKILRCNGSVSFAKTSPGQAASHVSICYADEGGVNDWNGAWRLYNDILGQNVGGSTPPPPPPPTETLENRSKRNILNRIHQSYLDVRNSRYISSEDQYRLDEHISLVHELQASFPAGTGGSNPPPVTSGCVAPVPAEYNRQQMKDSYNAKTIAYLKLMRIAITCGLTRVGLINLDGHGFYDIGPSGATFPSGGLPLHNGYIHPEPGVTVQQQATVYQQWMTWNMNALADHILAPLQATPDPDDPSRSLLSAMLVAVLSEAGVNDDPGAHYNQDYQPILFGNMGGVIASNRYVAFTRNTTAGLYGIPYNQLLITFLQAMGIPESTYGLGSSNNTQGFGHYVGSGSPYYSQHSSRFYQPIQEIWNG